jgi:hypothetical protein
MRLLSGHKGLGAGVHLPEREMARTYTRGRSSAGRIMTLWLTLASMLGLAPLLVIFKYNGQWLRRAAFNNRWALSADCCCEGCCGRQLPGPTVPYKTGANYYPTTMNCSIEPLGDCGCPAGGVTFTLEWQGDAWARATTPGNCTAMNPNSDFTDVWLQCGEPVNETTAVWRAHFSWGVCGAYTFDVLVVLTDGECNPLVGAAEVSLSSATVPCCGTFPPLTDRRVRVSVWE